MTTSNQTFGDLLQVTSSVQVGLYIISRYISYINTLAIRYISYHLF